MRPSPTHAAPDERGFILVGVVTFMLALTILGLSLFALSSYEGQFFVASAAREQSLQNSESGMELVKTLLAAPGSKLENAHRAEGQMGITSALAYQWRSGLLTDTSSTGPVNWDSTLVIVVGAKSGGVERTLQAKFIPSLAEDPYQRLLAAGQGVAVSTSSSDVLQFSGRVWQPVESDADTAWTENVDWRTGRPVERGTPPAPMADAFVDEHLPSAAGPSSGTDLSNHEDYQLTFAGSADFPSYFHSPPSPTDKNEADADEYHEYTFYVGADLHINVRGVVVWVIPQGVCFKDQVIVNAVDSDIPSALVIVAEANGRDPGYENRGIWFRGGLEVNDNVGVYLVSQGDISLVQFNDVDKSHDARTVSIVAGGRIEIGGPQSSDTFKLGYDPVSMDPLADQLLAMGALPPVKGGTGAIFVVARQSWVETTPR